MTFADWLKYNYPVEGGAPVLAEAAWTAALAEGRKAERARCAGLVRTVRPDKESDLSPGKWMVVELFRTDLLKEIEGDPL